MILLCLRKSPIFKSGTNVIQQNAHALCLYSFLDCIFIVAWDCCLFVPWVFGDTSKTDKKLTVPTLLYVVADYREQVGIKYKKYKKQTVYLIYQSVILLKKCATLCCVPHTCISIIHALY